MSSSAGRLSDSELLDILSLSENATAIYTTEDVIIQSANDAMIRFWGKDKSVIGKPIAEAIPELKGQPFVAMLASVWTTGRSIKGTDTAAQLEVDGELQTFYWDFHYRAILNPDGTTRAVMHIATDVTERFLGRQRENILSEELRAANYDIAAANEELTATNEELSESQQNLLLVNSNLAESEAQLQFAIDAASLGTWDLNPATGRFSGNDRLKSWFGLKPADEIELSKATDVMADVDRARVIAAIAEAMQYRSGGMYDIEYTIINPLNNEPRIVNAKGKALFNIDNQVVRFSGTLQDITVERKAKKELEDINERLEMALDAGKLGSYDMDIQTGKMFCTDQCKKNFGRPLDQPFDYGDLMEVIQPEYREYVSKQVQYAIDNNTVYHAEYAINWPDGSVHWISASGTPKYDDAGRAVRMVGVTYDITERRLQEQRKDDFISIASHELKTPVTSLKASLQLLDRMKDDPKPQVLPRLIEQSNRSMEKITSLIEDLLNVSRMNEGQLRLNKTTFTIAELLVGCCDHVRAAGKHDLIIQGDESLTIYADEHRIDQVVVNLVNYAVKYAPNSKEIYFMIAVEDNMAKVSVKDDGPGIAPEKQAHLFDRYYQATGGGFQNSGLGLGLYISSEIISRHGGKMGVESELGKGSTFWFTLPLPVTKK